MLEHSIAMEMWIALIGASCITGWLVGDWNGSERMRKLIGNGPDAGFDAFEPLKAGEHFGSATGKAQGQAQAQDKTRPNLQQMGTKTVVTPAADAPAPSRSTQIRGPLPKARYKERFDAMPPLSEVRDQAEAIRRDGSVWDHLEVGTDWHSVDAEAASLLNHYQNSIDRLQGAPLSQSKAQFQAAKRGKTELELPRVSDAAHASPFFGDKQKAHASAQTRNSATALDEGNALLLEKRENSYS